MAGDDRSRALPSELGVAALVVGASLPLGRLFRTGDIFATAILAAGASTVVAWGLRRLRAPAVVSVAASLAAFLWFASIAFFRSSAFGPFPTPHSIQMIWHATGDAIQRSQTDVAPVASTPAFLCLSAFAIWATAWLADDAAIKLRHPMLAIGVTIPLYVLPGTILQGNHRWADTGLYLAAALWVLFSDERFRLSRWGRVVGSGVPGWRPGLAARMGGLAILLALIAAPVLPGFGAPPKLRGSTGGANRTTLNPLVSIRPQLNSKQPVEVFSVRSRTVGYWRLTALDRFDGLSWTSGPQRPDLPVSGRTIEPQNADSTERVVQDFEIRGLGGPWLPASYEPVRVDGLRGAGADPRTRTLISPDDLRRGMTYRVTSRVPRLTFEALDLAPPVTDPALRPYLELPTGPLTRRVAAISRQIVTRAHASDDNPFRQAVAIQNYLRTFTYDENVALTHTINDIVDFLDKDKAGYCEQFATVMAVMARTLGLPSRVAIGFVGGSQGDAPDQWIVTSRNAHAWVEVMISGFGWVQFEPTPRADSVVVPAYTSPTPTTPGPSAAPSAKASAQPTPSATTRPQQQPEPTPGVTAPGTGSNHLVGWVSAGGGSLLGIMILAFPLAGWARRSMRRRRAHGSQDLIAVRYLEFLDWCAATGRPRDAGETPLEYAARLADASSDRGDAATSLARLALGAVYAAPNGIDPAAAAALARSARREAAAALPRRTRLLARFGWRWWKADPASRAPRRERESVSVRRIRAG